MKINTYDLPDDTIVIRKTYYSPVKHYIIFKGFYQVFTDIEDLADELALNSEAVFVDDEETVFSISIITHSFIPRDSQYDFEFRAELLDNFDTIVVTSI